MRHFLRRHKKGFTIIEVSLFLAITGLLMVGILSTTSGSINRHRYDDVVQDFYSFLTSLYSAASNVQNTSSRCTQSTCGQTDQAVYGFIAIFGSDPTDLATVHTYNLRGKADITVSSDRSLRDVLVDPVEIKLDKDDGVGGEIRRTYKPIWDGAIQTTGELDMSNFNASYYRGAVAIIRSPLDGTLTTYTYDGEAAAGIMRNDNNTTQLLARGDNTHDADFCVWSEDLRGNQRRNVRIHANGRTASAVEIIAQDSEGEGGNRCR